MFVLKDVKNNKLFFLNMSYKELIFKKSLKMKSLNMKIQCTITKMKNV